MENSLDEETSNFCSIIKNILGKDVVDSKMNFGFGTLPTSLF